MVTKINQCTSDATFWLRDEIRTLILEGLTPCASTSASCAAPELAAYQMLL